MIIKRINKKGELIQYSQADKLYEIEEGFKNAVERHHTSTVTIIDGKSGMGKTTLALQKAKTLDPNFDLHKVHYSTETFLEGGEGKIGLANAKAGDCLVFDESAPISNRSSLSKMNRMIVQAMTMIRSKQIYIIFCINSFFDLDKNLAIFRCDLLLHVYGEHLYDRGKFASFFRGKDKRDRIKELYIYGKKMYDYSKPKANFTARFSKTFIVDEKKYNKQKDEGVRAFLMGEQDQSTKKPRNNLIVYTHQNKLLSVNELSEICDISIRQVYRILKIGNSQKDIELKGGIK